MVKSDLSEAAHAASAKAHASGSVSDHRAARDAHLKAAGDLQFDFKVLRAKHAHTQAAAKHDRAAAESDDMSKAEPAQPKPNAAYKMARARAVNAGAKIMGVHRTATVEDHTTAADAHEAAGKLAPNAQERNFHTSNARIHRDWSMKGGQPRAPKPVVKEEMAKAAPEPLAKPAVSPKAQAALPLPGMTKPKTAVPEQIPWDESPAHKLVPGGPTAGLTFSAPKIPSPIMARAAKNKVTQSAALPKSPSKGGVAWLRGLKSKLGKTSVDEANKDMGSARSIASNPASGLKKPLPSMHNFTSDVSSPTKIPTGNDSVKKEEI